MSFTVVCKDLATRAQSASTMRSCAPSADCDFVIARIKLLEEEDDDDGIDLDFPASNPSPARIENFGSSKKNGFPIPAAEICPPVAKPDIICA